MRPIFIRARHTPRGVKLFASHDALPNAEGRVKLALDSDEAKRMADRVMAEIIADARRRGATRVHLHDFAGRMKQQVEATVPCQLIYLSASNLGAERIMLRPCAS